MNSIDDVQLHKLPTFRDHRGVLTAGEGNRDFPFEVRRYFVVYEVKGGEKRGQHAHRECHQFLTCVSGSCQVEVFDGERRKSVTLDSPELGLHIPPGVWGVQSGHSSDCILLVLASHFYDPKEYLHTESDFRAFRERG